MAKIKPDGTSLDYAGYIGGSGPDSGGGIAVDAGGHAYVTGDAGSTEATFPVAIGPDLSYNGGTQDAFVAKLSEPVDCALSAAPIGRLLAAKASSAPDSVDMSWQADLAANGYNIWYVTEKQNIPFARQTSSPPAIAVAACAVPLPASGPSCTDAGAVSRATPAAFFYQVHTYCDASTEGP